MPTPTKYAKTDVTVTPNSTTNPTSWTASCDTNPLIPIRSQNYTGVEWSMKSNLYVFTGVMIKTSDPNDTAWVQFNASNTNGSGTNTPVTSNFSNLSITTKNNKSDMTIDDSLTSAGSGDNNAVKFTYCIMGCLSSDSSKIFTADPQIYNEE